MFLLVQIVIPFLNIKLLMSLLSPKSCFSVSFSETFDSSYLFHLGILRLNPLIQSDKIVMNIEYEY